MTHRGLSATDIRKRNRFGLLSLVHRNGAIARNDLASSIGLTRASVTILVGELLEEGLIVEAGSSGGNGKAGRRKIFLRIRNEAGKLLGVGIDQERIQVLVSDLGGTVLGVRNLSLPRILRGAEPGTVFAKAAAQAVSELLGGEAAAAAGVLGAGVGVTGRVDPDSGLSLREPRLWEGTVAIREPFEAALGVPVSVNNNVRALSVAELLLTDMKKSPPAGLLLVKYGPGVGAAWTPGGLPWSGAHNRAGELGHTFVAADGPPCPYCGRRGCLESLVSAQALGLALSMQGSTVETLCAALSLRDPEAFALLASRFARALGNAIELCDPSVVTLYGLAFRDSALFSEVARRVEANDRPCEIKRSGLDPEFPALGGVALALERFFQGGGTIGK
ncbi:MAG: ROK family transcriptional regulator [Rectinemataceae bacterium]